MTQAQIQITLIDHHGNPHEPQLFSSRIAAMSYVHLWFGMHPGHRALEKAIVDGDSYQPPSRPHAPVGTSLDILI